MDIFTLKVFAQRLRVYLKHNSVSLNHNRALNLMAVMVGVQSWREVLALQKRITTFSFEDESYLRLISRLAKRYGKTVSSGELKKILNTHFSVTSNKGQYVATNEFNGSSGMVLKYIETDEKTAEPTGNNVSVVGSKFQALGYYDLISQKTGRVNIPLRLENATILESTIPDFPIDKLVDLEIVIESDYSSKTIGLVKGGWLPSGLALQEEMIVLLDRCTISEIFSRFSNGERRSGKNNDFLNLFENKRVRINPMLYALEGNLKKEPDSEIVQQQFLEASEKIKAALPMAELTPFTQESLAGLVGIIKDTQEGMARKKDFLIRIAPKISSPVSVDQRHWIWKHVLEVADSLNIPRHSLVVVAALSVISVPNGKSPAKKLLKLKGTEYSSEFAYNALVDLRALEILMYFFALFPEERIMLCTDDKDLALFWAGIRASNFSWVNGHFHCKLSPVESLLPNVLPELRASYFK